VVPDRVDDGAWCADLLAVEHGGEADSGGVTWQRGVDGGWSRLAGCREW
jgi:hypothetical protein